MVYGIDDTASEGLRPPFHETATPLVFDLNPQDEHPNTPKNETRMNDARRLQSSGTRVLLRTPIHSSLPHPPPPSKSSHTLALSHTQPRRSPPTFPSDTPSDTPLRRSPIIPTNPFPPPTPPSEAPKHTTPQKKIPPKPDPAPPTPSDHAPRRTHKPVRSPDAVRP